MTSIRLLIVDDHTLFRQGMRALLAGVPDVELVGEAASGEEAIQQATVLKPDVILMDIRMPGLNGIEALRRILAVDPATAVVVLTMLEDDDSVFAAIRAGARGYVLKGADELEMLRVLRAVAIGETHFGPAITERLMGFFTDARKAPESRGFPDLTEREREVLNLIAMGFDNSTIADRLFVSSKTIRNHITSIFDKLGVRDRAHAIVLAREAGFGH